MPSRGSVFEHKNTRHMHPTLSQGVTGAFQVGSLRQCRLCQQERDITPTRQQQRIRYLQQRWTGEDDDIGLVFEGGNQVTHLR